tara:strand:- start:38 stop:346 length:309 start_codon:yes stop_codon:yes gene_type:complete
MDYLKYGLLPLYLKQSALFNITLHNVTDDRQYREIKYEENTMRRDRKSKLNTLRTNKITGNSTVDLIVDGKLASTLIVKDNGNIDSNTGSVKSWDNYFKSRS